MLNQDTVDLAHIRQRQVLTGSKIMTDLAKDPGSALCSTTDHDGIRASVFEYLLDLLGGGDIAIGDDGYPHLGLHRCDGIVFSITGICTCTGTPMNGNRTDTRTLSDTRHTERIPMLLVPTGSNFQGDGDVHSTDHCIKYSPNQHLILQ